MIAAALFAASAVFAAPAPAKRRTVPAESRRPAGKAAPVPKDVQAPGDDAARWSWLTGRWNVEMTWIASGKAQAPSPVFAADAARDGEAVVIRSAATDILRATSKDGEVAWAFWQPPMPHRPGNCAVPTGWQPVSVDVSADKRTLTFRAPSYWTHACELGGVDDNVYRLLR